MESALAKGIQLYYDLKKQAATKYNFKEEQEFNSLGYNFLQNGAIEEAVETFKLWVAEFPNNYNPYDSFGETYFYLKNYKLSGLNYKNSLALKPENATAVAMLKKLDLLNQ